MSLLRAGDPPAFSTWNESGRAPLLLLCDHAGKAIPQALGDLGIEDHQLSRHIGWDIGALEVARELSRRLDAPLVSSTYSRLVIDCNRWPGGEGSVPPVSDGVVIPANADVSEDEIQARAHGCFWPYHEAVDAAIDRFLARGIVPALLVIHSFTPHMNNVDRPWHVGVLWDQDARLPAGLLEALRRQSNLVVGDNEPYSARASYVYTLRTHAVPHKLPHCSLEIRQDLIGTTEAALDWAGRLATPIAEAVELAVSSLPPPSSGMLRG
jgi:predicted N-formylglutamate amidohydrolase